MGGSRKRDEPVSTICPVNEQDRKNKHLRKINAGLRRSMKQVQESHRDELAHLRGIIDRQVGSQNLSKRIGLLLASTPSPALIQVSSLALRGEDTAIATIMEILNGMRM
jgi:hypothetical protein